MPRIKFTDSPAGAGRKHYLNEYDVRVLLSRLPKELWARLRAVHFNDRARGNRVAGYVNRGHREIAICAMPARVSMSAYLAFRPRSMCGSPSEYGAVRGMQWPELAVRRFQLYDTFLHELGHLQIIDSTARSLRRKFAKETRAQEFANYWRRELWSSWFDHPDPVHNRATGDELERLNQDSDGCFIAAAGSTNGTES
jgi:hypothetical protein